MKFYLLLLSLALVSAAIDYENVANTFPSFTQCTKPHPWANIEDTYNFQSPIAIKNSQCLPYGYFGLTMNNPGAATPTVDSESGALIIPYDGAKLQKDQFQWTSDSILIRRASEHRLYIGNPDDPTASAAQADLEVQIRMNPSTSSGTLAFLSFLVKSYNYNPSSPDPTELAHKKSSESVNIISASSSNSVTFDLNDVATTIMGKINAGLYLNMFTYNGTTTYPPCRDAAWFIYGNYLYVDISVINNIDTLISNYAGTTSGTWGGESITLLSGKYNYRPASGNTAGVGGGAQTAARLCFSGYFDVYLNWNYGLWFGVVIIVFFFIITLSTGESPITDPDYKEECKTIHPWVSLWVVGNELHTRKTRSSLILAIITIHALFDSVWYRISNNPEQPANIIVYAAYSMVISQVFIQFYGIILRQYYIAKRQFLQTKEEKWNQRAQNRLFAFYSALFALIAICWPFCVWNMNELNPHRSQKSSNYWVASFFVGLGLEWLFVDIIWILLAKKINFVKNLMRKRGFFYDDLCHATYMDFIKMD